MADLRVSQRFMNYTMAKPTELVAMVSPDLGLAWLSCWCDEHLAVYFDGQLTRRVDTHHITGVAGISPA